MRGQGWRERQGRAQRRRSATARGLETSATSPRGAVSADDRAGFEEASPSRRGRSFIWVRPRGLARRKVERPTRERRWCGGRRGIGLAAQLTGATQGGTSIPPSRPRWRPSPQEAAAAAVALVVPAFPGRQRAADGLGDKAGPPNTRCVRWLMPGWARARGAPACELPVGPGDPGECHEIYAAFGDMHECGPSCAKEDE